MLPLPVFALAAAMHSAPAPAVDHAWARPTMGAMGMSAVYLDLHGGAAADALVGASTPAARSLQLHRSVTENGVSGMRPAATLPVPAHGEARLAPGGYHLMLMGAARPLKPGDHVRVTLRFRSGASRTLDVPVRPTPP